MKLGDLYFYMLTGGGTFLVLGLLFGGHHFHHGLGHGLQHGHGVAHHLNLLNLAAFITAFGAVGVIGTASFWDAALGLFIATIAGVGMALFSGWFIEKMVESQSTSQPDDTDYEGIPAVVSLAIPMGGVLCGEIRAIVKDQIVVLRAKPHNKEESFDRGTAVVTMDFKGGVAYVIRDTSHASAVHLA